LSGDEIPITALIIGCADAFDSMTAERVYSKPRTPEDAIREIVSLRGQQFDPNVVDALCQLMVYNVDSLPFGDEDDGHAAAA
jgi:HD-GYP domain-containing protein (c-di-GMP phosphodiesterase class II)